MNRTKILVWDIPTRAFHWLLAGSFAGAYLTAESESWRLVHVTLGYTFAGLLLFRLAWGFFGSRHARFADFAFGPRRVAAYLRSLLARRPEPHAGHNPAGGWAIFALLLLGAGVATSGVLLYNELGGEAFEDIHEALANGLLALVGVHLAGVAVGSLAHRENLPRAMVTGYKDGEPAQAIARSHWVVGLALVGGVVAFWANAFGLREALAGAPVDVAAAGEAAQLADYAGDDDDD